MVERWRSGLMKKKWRFGWNDRRVAEFEGYWQSERMVRQLSQ